MSNLRYLNSQADFVVEDAYSLKDLYFPLVNESGMMSSITAELAGDCKTGQDTWLLAPASSETLHESRATRNFWVKLAGGTLWSVCGGSAMQQAQRFSPNRDKVTLYGGLLWQKLVRENAALGILSEVLSFVPSGTYQDTVELMQVTIRNTGAEPMELVPTAAIPLYGRSAADIRDHRHVTSLLHRLAVEEYGVTLRATLTFDERGHQKGKDWYQVFGCTADGSAPVRMLGPVQDYVGVGSYDLPQALAEDTGRWLKPGDTEEGYEMMGALQFAPVTLAPGEETSYYVVMGIDAQCGRFVGKEAPAVFSQAFEETKAYWQAVSAADFTTGDDTFNAWMRWVAIQPQLRRICGCSFLPHHDYGRGGRGWRDLWQDCLSLILREPEQTRNDLKNYFAGVRGDGTNATIIGRDGSSFVADRNSIVRVWMDHGFWPLRTVDLYIQQSGDLEFLLDKAGWFCDSRKCHGEVLDSANVPASNRIEHEGTILESTLLEHLLVQNVTSFCDPGAHGNIRLRGADWNDGLDQAVENGESVAFTAAYAGNLKLLASLCRSLSAKKTAIDISAPLASLMEDTDFTSPEARKAARKAFELVCENQAHIRKEVSLVWLADTVDAMGNALMKQLRENEYLDCGWFNSYYDNNSERTDGFHHDKVSMLLTGQVFSILSGTADDAMTASISANADRYLFDPSRGGYFLNTCFGKDIPPLGRMLGFAYGHKENGAVFCHMSVMYAYALYSRGLKDAGWKVLKQLYLQSSDFANGRIYPGVPEYFDIRGKGMYPYLTGAGSWYMLTMLTMAYGIRGKEGDLEIAPQLTAEQFDAEGNASVSCWLQGRKWNVVFRNPGKCAEYAVKSVTIDGISIPGSGKQAVIPRETVANAKEPTAVVELG